LLWDFDEDIEKKLGFYAFRYAVAESIEGAEEIVFKALKKQMNELFRNTEKNPPRVTIEKTWELDSYKELEEKLGGATNNFIFFPDED